MFEVLKFVFYVRLFFCFGRDTVRDEGLCDISKFLYSNSVIQILFVWFDIVVAVMLRRAVWQLCANFSKNLFVFFSF